MQLSCLFYYEKRAYFEGQPLFLEDGKTVRTNPNYISFLQVISCYWEPNTDGKMQLNIFLNGGSISKDRETGKSVMKPGFTVVLPEFLGRKFVTQFWEWSCAFGLGASPIAPAVYVRDTNEAGNTSNRRSPGRIVKDDDFIDPDAVVAAAHFEEN